MSENSEKDLVQEKAQQEETQGSKIKPVHIALFGVSAVALAAIVVALVLWLRTDDQPEPIIAAPVTGGRGTVVTEENLDEVRAYLDSPLEDGSYTTHMNVDWVFPSSSEPSTNAFVENSTLNARTVYFDLVLADTNELIYSSPFIPVGSKIEKFSLDAQVPAGEYRGIVTYHLVDDDFEEITTVSVSVKLRVLG